MEGVLAGPVLVVTRVHRKLHLRAGEWLTALMLLSWGVELLFWPTLFQRDFFAGFLRWAPQSVWAATLLLIGSLRLVALTINGSWRYSAFMRMALLAASVLVWAALVHGIWASNRGTIAIVIYPWLAAADIYAAYRAGRDARAAMEEVHVALRAV